MLAIFESHPVQYRAPVYQELQRLIPGSFHVIYGTDISMRKNGGVGFGKTATWDVPLLDGYPHTILDQERGNSLENFRSLRGSGLSQVFAIHRPKAILQTQFLYEYDFVALFQARIRRIPVWIRLETQDEAVHRSPGKNLLRSAVYRLLYSQVQKGFYIGELNREHLQETPSGFHAAVASFALAYCTGQSLSKCLRGRICRNPRSVPKPSGDWPG